MEGKDEVLAVMSSPQGWSQLPAEILGIIFSYLQRKCDLLNGRLVCRSWNQECVRVLQKPESEFNQTLTESNVKEYLNFISDGHNLPELVLPFHLSVTIRAGTGTGQSNSDPTSEEMHDVSLNNLTEHVESLCAAFSDECIQKVTLKSIPKDLPQNNKTFVKRWLIEFLNKVSRGLKILCVSDFPWRLGNYTDDEAKSMALKICDLSFPKLKTLNCYGYVLRMGLDDFANANNLATNPIHKYIIERSPNLENYQKIDCGDLIQLPVNFDKLKSLLLDEIIESPSMILDKFRQSTNSSVLQELRFGVGHWTRARRRNHDRICTLHDILKCVSSTLNSLTLKAPYNESVLARLLTLPILPSLQYLRLNVKADEFLIIGPRDGEINFNPERLPVLKSVDLPIGLILGDYSVRRHEFFLEEEMEASVCFTRVNELTIRLSHNYWMSGNGLHKGVWAMKHLLRVFPNITKLSIKNESIKANEQPGVKLLLQFLMQSLSKNIHEICIDGFEQDFTGQVLQQMGNIPRRQGQGPGVEVRKVRLGLSAVTHAKCRSDEPFSPSLCSVPELMAMARYFPALQIIEISDLLFREMTKTERNEQLRTLASTFPYLWVHVIY